MVAFYPQFQMEGGSALKGDHEFIFLLDCSSSMKGEPFEDMKRCMLSCIQTHLDKMQGKEEEYIPTIKPISLLTSFSGTRSHF